MSRTQARKLAQSAQDRAHEAHRWAATANDSQLASALATLAEAFIISTCAGDDPCGVCVECKAQDAIAAADAEAHRGVA